MFECAKIDLKWSGKSKQKQKQRSDGKMESVN